MANPFYARYIPLSTAIVRKEPDSNFESHSGLDRAHITKKRKTKSDSKPIVQSGEEIKIPNECDDSVLKTNEAQLPDGQHGNRKKKGTEKNGKSGSLMPLALSESVRNVESSPESTLEEEIARTEVQYISETLKGKNKTRKQEKKKNEPSSTVEGGAVDNKLLLQNFNETKHKKIRAKYEKAAKDSSQRVENAAASKIGGLEEHEREPTSPIEIHGLEPLPQPPQTPDAKDKPTFSGLPDWLVHSVSVSSLATIPLDSLNLNPRMLTALKLKGYHDAFAIQAAVLPLLLPGSQQQHSGDICISAETGSGKTLAYALPMVENLRDKPVIRLRGLVVVPTRELVAQVRECFEMCGAGSGLKIGTAVGSKSLKEEQLLLIEKGQKYDPSTYRAEREKLSAEDNELMDWDTEDAVGNGDDFEYLENYVVEYCSKVDILICTPGRLVEHIQSTKGFTLNHVQYLVIDEADRLLHESFQQWVEIVMPALEYQPPLDPVNDQLLSTFHLLRRRKVQKIILSATMTRDVGKLTALKLRQPKLAVLEMKRQEVEDNPLETNQTKQMRLDLKNSIKLPPTLKEAAIPISNTDDKPLHLIEILEREPAYSPGLNEPRPKKIKSQPFPESTEILSSDRDETSDCSSSNSSTSSSLSFSDRSKSPTLKPQPLEASPPPDRAPMYGTLVFTNNNENAIRLATLLTILRPAWHAQIGTLTKSTSSAGGHRTLARFRAHKLTVLIASDRASRGLDIPHLAHVINYDLPTSVTGYVHRVGRTARAGREGRATTLVVKHEAHWFWNEIARGGGGIVRAAASRVVRAESRLDGWGKVERREYMNALKRLGEEAKGGR